MRVTPTAIVLGLALALAAAMASAQAYPTRPIRFVVPFAPGGTTDAVSRLLGQSLAARMGKPVVVENRPGAEAILGTDAVAKAAADGHTIGFALSSTLAILPHTRQDLPYDPRKDFDFISQIAHAQMALAINPSVPALSVGELVALARAKPGALTYASASEGGYIAGEMFKLATGTDIVRVPYKGGAPATNDLLSGQVHMMFATFGNAIPYFQGGRLKALAVTGDRRAAALPQVPTMREAGIADFEFSSAYGVIAPRGIPKGALERLNREIVAALGAPEVAEKFAALGVEPKSSSPSQYAELVRAEDERYRELLPRIGFKAH